jgi:hypothetical protein
VNVNGYSKIINAVKRQRNAATAKLSMPLNNRGISDYILFRTLLTTTSFKTSPSTEVCYDFVYPSTDNWFLFYFIFTRIYIVRRIWNTIYLAWRDCMLFALTYIYVIELLCYLSMVLTWKRSLTHHSSICDVLQHDKIISIYSKVLKVCVFTSD